MNVIAITSPCTLTATMLGIRSHWEGVPGSKPAQACCLFKAYFISCLVFITPISLRQVFTSRLCPQLLKTAREDIIPY